MSLKDRMELLPYGSTKSGVEVGFDTCEKGDISLYFKPFDEKNKSETRKSLNKVFPSAKAIDRIEDEEGAFWAVQLPETDLKLVDRDPK